MSVPERSFEPGAACPLDGVRVIDMSRLVSGNMVSLQLADFGAEVIKIEDPRRGDPLRAWQTNGVSVHDQVGHLPMHNVIPRLSAMPGKLRRPAPALGEHTAEILGGLGLERAVSDGLARAGVIGLGGE